MASRAWAMTASNASRVLACALRSSALSLENASSMGERSGEIVDHLPFMVDTTIRTLWPR